MRETQTLPIAVIGAGPIGLAAAAHLIERGIEPVVLEQAKTTAAAVREWGHVAMFSPWEFNTDRAAVALLKRRGWDAPEATGYPTGRELAERYLDPLAQTPEIAARLRLGQKVTGVTRTGLGKVRTAGRADRPFEIRTIDADGREHRLYAQAVIDASGTWFRPAPAGASGLPALGEADARERIRYGMPDVLGSERQRYAGRRVLVVGSGDSATGTLLGLAALAREVPATKVTWAARRRDFKRTFGSANDQLPERGALGQRLKALVEQGRSKVLAPFAVEEIAPGPDGSLLVMGEVEEGQEAVTVDEMIVATGLRPDLSFLGEVRLDLDPVLECPRALAPLIDPNVHSCGTVRPHGAAELAQPEPGLFIVGMKSYGRAPTFLLATGYEQARSVAAHLAGDHGAAARVELRLPETGVCSLPSAKSAEISIMSSCCGPKMVETAGNCCGVAA